MSSLKNTLNKERSIASLLESLAKSSSLSLVEADSLNVLNNFGNWQI